MAEEANLAPYPTLAALADPPGGRAGAPAGVRGRARSGGRGSPRRGGVMPLPLARFTGEVPSFAGGPPRVAEWRDARGRRVARGTTEGGYHWMEIDGVGTFRFPAEAPGDLRPEVAVSPAPGASPRTLEDFYLRSVLPFALQAYGLEALHGSAVHVGGLGVVALCGRPESGKSTLAYALAERGHAHVADDAVVIDPDSLRVLPLPTAARLRDQSAAHFGALSKRRVRVTLAGWDEAAARPLPLAAVVFLARGRPRVVLRRLGAREAFDALLSEAYAFTMTDVERKRSMLRAYLVLAPALRVYELSFPDGLEHLGAACDAIASIGTAEG